MTGKRDGNLRGGDLAQGLGCELLRRLCLVAPVPTTEDVGIDAVCTILRGPGRSLRASRTFGIQIKAASVRSVPLDDEVSAAWFHDLDIPYFLMSVNAHTAIAELYTFEGVLMSRLPDVTFFLDDPENQRTDRRIEPPPETPDSHHFWLGPPMMRFSFADLQEPSFCEELRALLEDWCAKVSRVLYARRLGTYEMLYWQTGHPARFGVPAMSAGADPHEFVHLFNSIAPTLSRLRLILNELGERSLEQGLHRLAVRAVELGADEPPALTLLPQDI